MSQTTGLIDKANAALKDLYEGLAADGFSLGLHEVQGRLVLDVAAGPEACHECLIPKEAFAEMATKLLDDAGVLSSGSTVEVIYPTDERKE